MFLLPILNDSFIKQVSSRYLDYCFDSNYCIISLNRGIIKLSLFIIINQYNHQSCQINFSANSSYLLFHLISKHSSLYKYISLNHILYIGKEVYKAELSNIFHQVYIQL